MMLVMTDDDEVAERIACTTGPCVTEIGLILIRQCGPLQM